MVNQQSGSSGYLSGEIPEFITLSPGGMAGVVLHENASTGYRWEFKTDPADHEFAKFDWATTINNPLEGDGRPSLRVLAVTGVMAGQTFIELDWMPPGASAPKATHKINVTVVDR